MVGLAIANVFTSNDITQKSKENTGADTMINAILHLCWGSYVF